MNKANYYERESARLQKEMDEERRVHKEMLREYNRVLDGVYDRIKRKNPSFVHHNPPPPRQTTQTTDKDEAEKILKTFNITTKLEWKKWLAQHHSDKGGSYVLTQEVINAGKEVYG